MHRIIHLNRRDFLKYTLIGSAGLLIGCTTSIKPVSSSKTGEEVYGLNVKAWLHISPEGVVTYQVPSAEMGQGVLTALTMIVAEELDADWEKMNPQFAPKNPAFGTTLGAQVTGGSSTIKNYWEPMRELGASARAMLVEAAALQWGVSPTECRTDNGFVIHSSGQKLHYGELAERASQISPPSHPGLKNPKDFKLIGHPIPRKDTPLKVTGQAQYGVDVQLDDLLIATLALSPVFGGQVKRYNEEAAMNSKGVVAVVPIPGGVAVVADSYWHALKGVEALKIEWDEGKNRHMSTESINQEMISVLNKMESAKFPKPIQTLQLEYSTQFLCHAPLEPMNCTAYVTENTCELWVPTQNFNITAIVASRISGVPQDQIKINRTYLGGGFGRRLEGDFVEFAVHASKAVKKPVKLIWSREEDLQHSFYRSGSKVRFQLGLDDQGVLQHWHCQLASPFHLERTMDENLPAVAWFPYTKLFGDPSVANGMSQGVFDPNPFPYQIEDFNLDIELLDLPIPMGSHRSVMHSYTGFYKESAMDEAAHAAGKDPYEYRRMFLKKEPNQLRVLDLAAQKANWGKAPTGRFQGISLHKSFMTSVAEVAELSVADDGKVTIHKITAVVDCGLVVNPEIVKAQIEGGIFWALTATFTEEITFRNGRVQQSNFHDYQTLRTKDAPVVDVHIVTSQEPPTGVGEPGVPPLPAAITNAIFAATGKRARNLPLSKEGFYLSKTA